MLNTSLGRLRLLGMIEGASFLVLLFVAMPLKYLAGRPEMVSAVGMAHGVLFVAFCAAVLQVGLTAGWPLSRIAGALAAAVVPFGPFVLDSHLRREEAAARQVRAG